MNNAWLLASTLLFAACAGQTDPNAADGQSTDDGALEDATDDEVPLEGAAAADGTLSYRDVLSYAYGAGVPCNARAITAAAVARAESSFRPTAYNANTNGSWDYGLWQINSVHGYSQEELADPATNAAAMASISDDGRTFQPWTMYRNGGYKKYVASARAALNAYGCQ